MSVNQPDYDRGDSDESSASEFQSEYESEQCFAGIKNKVSSFLGNGTSFVDENIMKEQQNKMQYNKLALLRIFFTCESVIELTKLAFAIDFLVNPVSQTALVFQSVQWILEITAIGCLILSKKNNEVNFVYPTIFARILMVIFATFDKQRSQQVNQ